MIGGALLMLGTITAVMGILADLIATNRKLLEMNLAKLRQIEETLATNTARETTRSYSPQEVVVEVGRKTGS